MNWTVETLDTTVDAEIEELPPALRSRLVRLMETIENVGLERVAGAARQTLEWQVMGVAGESVGGRRSRSICDGNGEESRYPPCFR
jgi:hypothetical protein